MPAGRASRQVAFAEARAREGGTVVAHEVEVRVVESGALAMVCRPLVIYMHPVLTHRMRTLASDGDSASRALEVGSEATLHRVLLYVLSIRVLRFLFNYIDRNILSILAEDVKLISASPTRLQRLPRRHRVRRLLCGVRHRLSGGLLTPGSART